MIDCIFENDHGMQEIDLFIKKLEKSKITRKAILKIRNKINPVTFEEMLDIGEIWVESAMALSQKEVKVMQRLVRSQDRMAKSLLHTVAVDLSVDKVSV